MPSAATTRASMSAMSSAALPSVTATKAAATAREADPLQSALTTGAATTAAKVTALPSATATKAAAIVRDANSLHSTLTSGAASPGAVLGSSAGVSNGGTVLPAPSAVDRGTRGLGPVAVSICKPLVFKVSTDTDMEIIHTSSVFEAHGLICKFRGFWPSLPQLHTWISQSWEPIIKG
ncbi:hypothetical protein SUGI_1502610 [Cryptomeria japonica]|uniref:Uncharacterized protein n=1 Tax=Cryptomeria japonica TaxID=3369 RepID=A0AAD3NU69_CRYJA|nr:hypothetical protein SUGI_1502610 [Cryptomeria japonica]